MIVAACATSPASSPTSTRARTPATSTTTITAPPLVLIPVSDDLLDAFRNFDPAPSLSRPERRLAPHQHAAPSPAGTAGVEQWRSLVEAHFRPGDVERMLRVIRCESSGNPSAVGRDGDSGLFQHLNRYWDSRSAAAGIPGADIFDPTAGAVVAAWLLYDAPGGGWSHWTCSGS